MLDLIVLWSWVCENWLTLVTVPPATLAMKWLFKQGVSFCCYSPFKEMKEQFTEAQHARKYGGGWDEDISTNALIFFDYLSQSISKWEIVSWGHAAEHYCSAGEGSPYTIKYKGDTEKVFSVNVRQGIIYSGGISHKDVTSLPRKHVKFLLRMAREMAEYLKTNYHAKVQRSKEAEFSVSKI